jgi:hypothetical protein
MFYTWHTMLVAAFVSNMFVLGYKSGQKSQLIKKLTFNKILFKI